MIKKLFKNKRFTVWFSVTVALVVLMVVIGSILGTVLYDVLKAVLGREIAVYEEGSEPRFIAETTSKKDAFNKANELNVRVCEDGSVLLKNDGDALPLAAGSKISVFGKNSANIVYGGSGSGGGNENGRVSLYDALRADGFVLNDKLTSFYNSSASGSGRSDNPDDLDTGADVDLSTGETPYASYGVDITNSYKDYNDAALIVLSRIGGEGFDLPRQSVDDSSRHYLELDPNEVKLVQEVTAADFKKVVVIINSSAVMELGWVKNNDYGKIDACLWIGAPGNSGIKALGRLLKGDVTPSGRTVDTWAADLLASPAAVNFGSNGEAGGDAYYVLNSEGKPVTKGYFVEYEEGIYVGYRYYETRGYDEDQKEGAVKDAWYNANVVYPFGYGKSYTTFTSEIVNKNELNGKTMSATEKFTVEVKVKNIGDKYSGKEVVQIYATPKYNKGGIEKAHKVLCGFAKTGELAIESKKTAETPNEQTLKVEIDPYYLASYDYSGKNSADYKGYILEKGEYVFTLGNNAHDEIDSFTLVLNEDHKFEMDTVLGKTRVENRFDDIDDELETVLSRANWNGTWPDKPTYEERVREQSFIDSINSTKHNNPNKYTEMPKTEQPVTITLFELVHDEGYLAKNKFEQYDDERWEAILNSLSVKEMADLVNKGAFNTQAITKIEKSATVDADGPAGFTVFMGDPTIYDTCAYASEVVMASTWDVDVVKAVGNSIGEEGLWGNQKGDGSPYSGIYAPGANIHRTPFGGRNFEYFSEDSYLSGVMAANEIEGAAEKGVYMYMKHFAANEQETHRSVTGLCTWLTEQSLREIYLRPFEIAVKEGNAVGMMSAFNRLGKTWAGGDYRLLTAVLRDEWGFRGTVISDFNTNDHMDPKQMVYAGGDLDLATMNSNRWMKVYKSENISDISVLRQAAKNILFTVSTSNAMNYKVKYYLLPAWLCVTIAIMCAIAAGLAVWGVFVIRATLKAIKAESDTVTAGAGADGDTTTADSEELTE